MSRLTIVLGLITSLTLAACRRPVHVERSADVAPRPEETQGEEPREGPVNLPQGGLTLEGGFSPVVERVAPAVVNVSTTRVVKGPSMVGPPSFFDDPLFREFFGRGLRPPGGEMRQHALGSGVIVSADGYVLTNAHVVQGANEVRVSLPDKRELKATIVGQDPKTDIALLRIPGQGFPVAELGDSSKLRVGDIVLAIGDPLGLGQTVTQGIISARGRGNIGIADYEDFIQTDAAINPGNSGGPLVDLHGRLIGINTAIATTGGGGGNQGIGFAVPINLARDVMRQIEQHGRVIRGWLGVAVQDVTSEMAGPLGLKAPGGALLGDVTDGSPAAKAGLQRGDVVTEIDGKPIADARALKLLIAEDKPGSQVRITVVRNGAQREVTVTLGEMPTGEKGKTPQAAPGEGLAIQVAPLTPELAHRLDVPEGTTGVVVTAVPPGSRAAEAGLRPGDLIQEIDKTRVHSPDDLKKALAKDGKQTHLLLVFREGLTHYVAVPPANE